MITLVIPVFNEEESVHALVDELSAFFARNSSLNAEVIFVNDGSSDQTADLLETAKHRNYTAKVINLSRNFGSHAAIRAGILNAEGEIITFNYADLQDPLDLIVQMNNLMQQGNDIIWGQRESVKVPLVEKLFSRSYAFLMKKYALKNFPEKGFDIMMFNRKVAEEINRNIEANSSVYLQILNLGFRQQYVSYKKSARKAGVSKWTLSKKVKLFIDSFVAFSYAPIRLVTIMGILFFLIGSIWTLYIITRELIFHDLASGWPALVSILMIGFGITNISLGIIAEYLWRTLDSSRKRPVFIVDSIRTLKAENHPGPVQTQAESN